MLLHANEEIARWRMPRKILRLPVATDGPAELWLCLCEYPNNDRPLEVRVNGRRTDAILPQSAQSGTWQWRRVPLRRGMLRAGSNEIILACNSPAMNSWMLAVEPGHRNPGSALSTDRGRSWRRGYIGMGGRLSGEYLIRVRTNGPRVAEQRVPAIAYESRKHPRVRELQSLVPAKIKRLTNPWRQVLALRNWVARAWTYEAFGNAYAPWDPWTVLAWKHADWGHGQPQPIAMCVHYGMVMCALASALGHVARGFAITQDVNSPHGHFMTEIWDGAGGKWVAHDSNYDLHYENEEGPMSGIELAERARAGRSSPTDVRQGGGFTTDSPRLRKLLNEKLATGQAFNTIAVWRRNDVISDPAAAPSNHGSVIYCETDLVWYQPDGEQPVAPMFPYRADRDYFTQAPEKAGGRA